MEPDEIVLFIMCMSAFFLGAYLLHFFTNTAVGIGIRMTFLAIIGV